MKQVLISSATLINRLNDHKISKTPNKIEQGGLSQVANIVKINILKENLPKITNI